jgi:ethanolamine utilization protein EutN
MSMVLLLVIEKTDATGAPTDHCLIAVDTVAAGAGERVLVLDEGNGARQVLASSDAPVRSVSVGVIDHVEAGMQRLRAAVVETLHGRHPPT